MRILIVEDSRTCRDMLAARLRAEPVRAEVVTAATLVEARKALASARFALVVLDLELGNERGAELLPLPCPVVIATSSPDSAPAGYYVVTKGRNFAASVERVAETVRWRLK